MKSIHLFTSFICKDSENNLKSDKLVKKNFKWEKRRNKQEQR
jgi:hypothetical protein